MFQPSLDAAYVVPSTGRQAQLRDGMRRFVITTWLFVLGCPLLDILGRHALKGLWISTRSPFVMRAALLVQMVLSLLYFAAAAGWLWWSLRRLTAGLQPTPPSWATSLWIRRIALRSSAGGLRVKAAISAVAGVGSVVVLIAQGGALSSHGELETFAVVGIGVAGLGYYLWYRFLMLARVTVAPNQAAAGDGRPGGVR